MRKEELLLANNILIQNDRMPTLRPGYTLVKALGGADFHGPILSFYDYQRSIDGKQFLLVQTATDLIALDASTGFTTGSSLVQSAGLTAPFGGGKAAYVEITPYELLVATPDGCIVLIDEGGIFPLNAVAAGLPAPNGGTPVIATGAGTLNYTFGYSYRWCWVRKWTDTAGTVRYHVGPPNDGDALNFAGPGSGVALEPGWSGSTALVPQSVDRVWLFRTFDTPLGSTSAYFFIGEVLLGGGGGTASWSFTDDNTDDALDLTRPVPYDNFPPPGGGCLGELHSRAVLTQIPGSPALVQVSGYDEILVGVPGEAWPPDLFFDVPAGRKSTTALATFQEKEFISSLDFWFTFSGYDISTFKLRDKACEPGAVGSKAWCTTATHLVFLGEDRNLWGWDGVSTRPVQFSKNLAKQLAGTLSMEDIDSATLSGAELQWYHFGRYDYIMVMVNTGSVAAGQYDWIQMWNAGFLGETYDDEVTPVGLVETDFFPSDAFSASGQVMAGNDRYVVFGDAAGNVYRWPDSKQDNGKNFAGALGSAWTSLNVYQGPMFHPVPSANIVKKMFFADAHTDRQDAVTAFLISAVVSDSPDMTLQPTALPIQPLPASGGRAPAPTAFRARFYEDPATSVGRWCRVFVVFPDDGGGGTLVRLDIAAKPIYPIAP